MKRTLVARPLRALLFTLGFLALLLGILSLPFRPKAEGRPPTVTERAAGTGRLSVGGGEALFDLPSDSPIAGFPRLNWASVAPPGPVGARALFLEAGGVKVAVVSVELLFVPAPLEAQVSARLADLHLDGILLAATHTHAGPGGFSSEALAEAIGTGPFRADVTTRIEETIERAVRAAVRAKGPARMGLASIDGRALVRNRDGGPKDGRLSVLRFVRLDGTPVADLSVLGAHATLLGRANRTIDGDWPGRFMAERQGGVRLFLQGTIGDQSATLPPPATTTVASYARAVSALVDGADVSFSDDPSTHLAYARVEVELPSLSPGAVPAFLWPALRSLFEGSVPRAAPVSALRIGGATLVGIPGEPVALVTSSWRRRPDLADVIFVSLADAYIGYVETTERFLSHTGETVRDYLGPSLADRLGEGVEVAVGALGR